MRDQLNTVEEDWVDLGAATEATQGEPIELEDEGVAKPNRRELF